MQKINQDLAFSSLYLHRQRHDPSDIHHINQSISINHRYSGQVCVHLDSKIVELIKRFQGAPHDAVRYYTCPLVSLVGMLIWRSDPDCCACTIINVWNVRMVLYILIIENLYILILRYNQNLTTRIKKNQRSPYFFKYIVLIASDYYIYIYISITTYTCIVTDHFTMNSLV